MALLRLHLQQIHKLTVREDDDENATCTSS